ncbi:Pyruvate dehydrogenase E1 component subunit beta [compost metagenome]|jgi:pyruvate dehydrogenase E1 component beta subunit
MSTDKNINLLAAVNLALHDAMESDPKVLVFGEDVADPEGGGVIGATKGLSERFGDQRVRSTPIAEQAIIGAAIGASLVGYKAVPEIMLMNFTTVAMDMIVNHAAKLRFMSGGQTSVPITIRTMTGAGMGNGGQHSDFLEAWFAHTAGLKVVIPSTPADAYGLLLSCIDDPDPCLFVETLPMYWTSGPAPVRGERIPLGQAKVVREGSDVSVITYGRQVHDALAVAKKLEGEGISIEVVDLRTVSPLDTQAILASVGKTGRAVVLHEATKKFGPGAEIASVIHEALFSQLKAPVQRIGAKFSPVPFSKPLETAFMPSQAELEAVVRSLVEAG